MRTYQATLDEVGASDEPLLAALEGNDEVGAGLGLERPRQLPAYAQVRTAGAQTAALAVAPGVRDGIGVGEVAVRGVVVGGEAVAWHGGQPSVALRNHARPLPGLP